MIQKITAFLYLLLFTTSFSYSQIIINEIDSDTPGADTEEFIELFDGGAGNTPLDGYVLVLYNGSNNASYKVFDLDGQMTDANGFFVLGSEAVSGVHYTPANFTSIQNGADAVALYLGEATDDFSIITTANLIDAVVYDNGQADDPELLVLLNPDEPQVNEDMNGNGTTESLQRVPDGGMARSTSSFIAASPTPGSTNVTKDYDSDIKSPVNQIPASYISSINDSDEEFIEVFKFSVADKGTMDGKSTYLSFVKLDLGQQATVGDLVGVIGGARVIKNGVEISGNAIIESASIAFEMGGNPLEILDGTANDLTLEIFLTKNVTDNEILHFEIPSEHSFEADPAGSDFVSAVSGVSGNIHTIEVHGTAFVFGEVPASIDILQDFAISILSVDENGNHDIDDNSAEVTLAISEGEGSLVSVSDPDLTKILDNGIGKWTDLQYNVVEDFVLEATGTLDQAVSPPITANPLDTRIYFEKAADNVPEAEGRYDIVIKIDYPDPMEATTAQLSLVSGDGNLLNDFDTHELVFPAGSGTEQKIELTFSDNSFIDGNKVFVFEITDVSGGKAAYIFGNTTFELTIEDDEFPAPGDVIISEIMYDSKSSTDEEWIELYNTTGSPINISGWYITDNDNYPALGEGDLVIPDNTIMAPGEYVVIAWKELTDYEEAIMAQSNSGARSLGPGLGNSGDNIALFSNAEGTGILVDGSLDINFNDASPANEGFSIERDPTNGYVGVWSVSNHSYNGSEIIKGTPGAINSTLFTKVQFTAGSAIVREESATVEIEVSIENPDAIVATSVDVKLVKGDAMDIDEYTTSTILFPPGNASDQKISITISDDQLVEENDTLIFELVNLTGGVNAYLGENSTFDLTIIDNDTTQVQFEATEAVVSEEVGVYELRVQITNPDPLKPTYFSIGIVESLSDGSAADLDDISFTTLSSEPGKEVVILPINVTDDALVEGDEIITFFISEVSEGNRASAGSNTSFTLKIVDNDLTSVEFELEEKIVNEGDGNINIPLKYFNPHPYEDTKIQVVFLENISTGILADMVNFEPVEITFSASSIETEYFSFEILEDALVEGVEALYFALVNPSGGNSAFVGEADTLKVTINDNDLTSLAFKNKSAEVKEGDEVHELHIQIFNPHPEYATSFDLVIKNSSSGNNSDIQFENQTLIFEPGASEGMMVPVLISDDEQPEEEEVIIFEITNVEGGNQASVAEPAEFSLLITDDDFTSVAFRSASATVDEGAGFYNLIVDVKNSVPENPLVVDVVLSAASEGDSSDINGFTKQTLDFSSFDSDTIKLHITDDLQYEGDESLEFNLQNIRGGIRSALGEFGLFRLSIKENDIPDPEIVVDAAGFNSDFGNVVFPNSSAPQSFTVSARYLIDDLIITPPAGFEISLEENFDGEIFTSLNTLKIKPSEGQIEELEIFLRFTPQAPDATYYNGEILILSSDANSEKLKVYGEEGTVIITSIEMAKTMNEEAINITGIVTTPDFGLENGEFFIQDATGGIQVFHSGIQGEVIPGDSVLIKGIVESDKITRMIVEKLQVIESSSIPEPLLISEEEIFEESFFGVRVKVENVLINNEEWPETALGIAAGGTVVSAEIDEQTFNIYIDAGESYFDGSTTPNQPFTLTGILRMVESQIQIMPFFAEDIDDPDPYISISLSDIDFGNVEVGTVSEIENYTINGDELIGNVTIEAPESVDISSSPDFNSFSSALVFSPDENGSLNENIYIRFKPGTTGDFQGQILHSTNAAEDVVINLSANGYRITAIDESVSDIVLYPVPANNYVFIKFAGSGKAEAVVFNALGTMLSKFVIKSGDFIDLSNFEAGIYYLQLKIKDRDIRQLKFLIKG